MWISFFNWVDARLALITADAEASSDLVAANLANRRGSRIWRTDELSAGSTAAGFTIDFGTAREIAVLALLFPRSNDPDAYDETPAIAATDTIRHRLDLTTAAAGALLDTGITACGALPGYGLHVFRLNAPVTARYWRCDLDAPSRAIEGYLDVARAWAGPILQPRVGITYGAIRAWASDSIIAKASRGTDEFIDSQESLRSWSFDLDWIDDATEADAHEDFDRRMTTAGQFLVCRTDLTLARGAMFARQVQSPGLNAANFGKSRKSYRLLETI